MGKAAFCEKEGLKKGPWSPEEDKVLVDYIQKNGHGSWRAVPRQAGLLRCGKSCRLRWTNYLRPDIKRGRFQPEEKRTILQLHAILGNRWSTIASQLPGRTDNEIKNFWNTHLKKELLRMGLDPSTHAPKSEIPIANALQGSQSTAFLRHGSQWEIARLEAEARLSRDSILSFSAPSSINKLMRSDNAEANSKVPNDIFLKLWNSESGKAFRKETVINDTKSNNNNSENPHGLDHDIGFAFPWTDTSPHLSLSPISSFCSQDQLNRGQTEGTELTHEDSSCFEELTHGHNAVHNHEIQDLRDLLLDSPDRNTANNSNIGGMMAELNTNSQLQSPLAWQEERLDEDNDYWNRILGVHAESSSAQT